MLYSRNILLNLSRWYHIRTVSPWWQAGGVNFSWWWWWTRHKINVVRCYPKLNSAPAEPIQTEAYGSFTWVPSPRKMVDEAVALLVLFTDAITNTWKGNITLTTLVEVTFFHLFLLTFSFTLYFKDRRRSLVPRGILESVGSFIHTRLLIKLTG